MWGAIQAGYYRDVNYKRAFTKYIKEENDHMTRCDWRRESMAAFDLSPTFAHLPSSEADSSDETMGNVLSKRDYRWRTFAVGLVELRNRILG